MRSRIAEVNEAVPGSIAEMLNFRFVSQENDVIVMTCQTMPWMRNPAGTLHGGLCATILDQAMGFVSYCLKVGEGTAPAIHLAVDYHRPLCPGEQVYVRVHVVNVSRNLMNLRAEAYQASSPERICLSASGVYFFKPRAQLFRKPLFFSGKRLYYLLSGGKQKI